MRRSLPVCLPGGCLSTRRHGPLGPRKDTVHRPPRPLRTLQTRWTGRHVAGRGPAPSGPRLLTLMGVGVRSVLEEARGGSRPRAWRLSPSALALSHRPGQTAGPGVLEVGKVVPSFSTPLPACRLPHPHPQSRLKPRLQLLIMCSFASSLPQAARSSEPGLDAQQRAPLRPAPPFPSDKAQPRGAARLCAPSQGGVLCGC